MIGETRLINGERWTIVDLAPAAPLAEMVAAILEDEGFVVMTRGAHALDDIFSHMGAPGIGSTVVLVPEADAERALALIRETVTDYQGEELEALMAQLEAGELPEGDEFLGAEQQAHEDEHGDG